MKVQGKVAVITGGARGIGRALGEELLRNGAKGGVIRGTLLAMKFMNPQNGGVVVNISSTAGLRVTEGQMPLIPVYTCAKAGVIAYTRCFALNKEVREKKIRMVCLCPKPTDTEMLKDDSSDKCWNVEEFYAVDRGRLMRVEELATIFSQLVQDDSNNGKVAMVEDVNKYTFV